MSFCPLRSFLSFNELLGIIMKNFCPYTLPDQAWKLVTHSTEQRENAQQFNCSNGFKRFFEYFPQQFICRIYRARRKKHTTQRILPNVFYYSGYVLPVKSHSTNFLVHPTLNNQSSIFFAAYSASPGTPSSSGAIG